MFASISKRQNTPETGLPTEANVEFHNTQREIASAELGQIEFGFCKKRKEDSERSCVQKALCSECNKGNIKTKNAHIAQMKKNANKRKKNCNVIPCAHNNEHIH